MNWTMPKTWLYRGLVLLLLIESSLLAWQNYNLKRKPALRPRKRATPTIAFSVGEQIGAISGQGIDGTNLRLEFPRANPVMLIFFSVSCRACEIDAESWYWLEDLSSTNPFDLLGICSGDTITAVRIFAATHHATFPIIHDETFDLSQRFGVSVMPLKLFVSPNGLISKTFGGGQNVTSYERTLRELGWLSEK